MNSTYNPLFIYGKSGLGKTHLLRAIQNYVARNDPSRLCVYRDASSFITDYTEAMRHSERSAASVLRQNYADIDVLIIDDIQKMAGKAGTVGFFFDTFNRARGQRRSRSCSPPTARRHSSAWAKTGSTSASRAA